MLGGRVSTLKSNKWRENATLAAAEVAGALNKRLKNVADEYLTHVNRDRPEHLEAILAPSIVPGE